MSRLGSGHGSSAVPWFQADAGRRLSRGGQLFMQRPGRETPRAPGNRCHEPVVQWGTDIGRRVGQRFPASLLPATRPGQEGSDPAAAPGDRDAGRLRALLLAGQVPGSRGFLVWFSLRRLPGGRRRAGLIPERPSPGRAPAALFSPRKLGPYLDLLPPLRRARIPHHMQSHRFAGQFLQFGAEPVQFRTAVAVRHARPGGLDVNLDIVQVPR